VRRGGAVLIAAREAHDGASLTGDAFVVAGVVAAAGYSVVARRVAPRGRAAVITAYQLLAALVLAVLAWSAFAVERGSTFGRPSISQWLAAAATGVLGSAIPFLLFTFAVARLPAVRTGLPLNLIPVFRVAASVLLLHERFAVTQLLGAALVVAGLGAGRLGSEA
jgi:drug/metabolite transporter (DMT)-like permease